MDDVDPLEFEVYYERNLKALTRSCASASVLGLDTGDWAADLLYHAAAGAGSLPDGARRYRMLERAIDRFVREQVANVRVSAYLNRSRLKRIAAESGRRCADASEARI